MDMTHPYIKMAEKYGYTTSSHEKIVGYCRGCGADITEGSQCQVSPEGYMFCGTECALESVGFIEREV